MRKNVIEEYNKRILKRKNISKKKFEAIKKDTDLVWTDNDVALRILLPFTARQLKIIDYALSEVKRQNINGEEDKLTIKTSDLITFLHMKNGGSSYLDLETDIKHIRDTSAWWRYEENGKIKKTLFAFFLDVEEVVGRKGTFTLRFKQIFLDKLNNIEPRIEQKKDGTVETIGFNFYPLLNIKDLKSRYSIILYKLCNVWKNAPRGYFERTMEEIKNDFLLQDYTDEKGKEHKYTYGYINTNCLQPAIKEINAKTDIHISKIEPYPNKKKVEKLLVYAYPKKEEKLLSMAKRLEEERDEYFDTMEQEAHEKSIDKAVKREIKREEKREKARIIKNYYKMQEEKAQQEDKKAYDILLARIEKYNIDISKIHELSYEKMKNYAEQLEKDMIEKRVNDKIVEYEKKINKSIYLLDNAEEIIQEFRKEVVEETNKENEEIFKREKE